MNGRALRAAPTGEVDSDGETPAWQRLAELDVPVLAVVGAHDLPHIRERTVGLDARIDGARTVVLAESAHVPQLDDPAALSELLAEILRRHPAERAIARTRRVLIERLVDTDHIHLGTKTRPPVAQGWASRRARRCSTRPITRRELTAWP